jgi:hypothetical protein
MPSMSAKRLKADIWKMAGYVAEVPAPDIRAAARLTGEEWDKSALRR